MSNTYLLVSFLERINSVICLNSNMPAKHPFILRNGLRANGDTNKRELGTWLCGRICATGESVTDLVPIPWPVVSVPCCPGAWLQLPALAADSSFLLWQTLKTVWMAQVTGSLPLPWETMIVAIAPYFILAPCPIVEILRNNQQVRTLCLHLSSIAISLSLSLKTNKKSVFNQQQVDKHHDKSLLPPTAM